MTNQIVLQNADETLNINTQIRQLEHINKELEDSLKRQVEMLGIHTQLGDPKTQLFDLALIKQIQTQHLLIHQEHSKHLLGNQIRIQEKSEMEQLIKNYQARIVELQMALTNKEGQIAEVTQDEGNDMLPRRENLRKLNIECIQKYSINKALHDLKKVNVQINALEYSLKQKLTKDKDIQNLKKIIKVAETSKPQPTLKEKNQILHKDKLLMKVYELLQTEIERENEFRCELNTLKDDLESVSKAHKQLAKRYKRLEIEKTCGNNISRQNYTENGERGLNFLEQLERAENQQIVQNNGLFHRVDLNVEKQKGKMERKRPISRERHKVSKEN